MNAPWWHGSPQIPLDWSDAVLLELQGGGPSTPRPGPELDRLVSQRILGKAATPEFCPSTRIQDAWVIHHHMYQMPNDTLASYLSELHRILFARWRDRTGARVIGPDTPGYLMELDPESICLAALKAIDRSTQ